MPTVHDIERKLSYATAVARERVHRDAICEVFLTDVLRRERQGAVVGVQLPRSHAYYSDHLSPTRHYDPLLLVEAFRQTSIAVAHECANAPVDSKFVFNSGVLNIADAAALTFGATSACGKITATITDEKTREGVVSGFSLEMGLRLEDRAAAAMTMTIQWMPGTAWDKVRARGRAALDLEPRRGHDAALKMPPLEVGRRHGDNVVLVAAERSGRRVDAPVIVDESHPSLFDHPLDHIPGAVLFEAYRQCGIVAMHEILGLSPKFVSLSGFDVVFSRFGELELPTDCQVELIDRTADGGAILAGTITQDGEPISSGTLRFDHTAPIREQAES